MHKFIIICAAFLYKEVQENHGFNNFKGDKTMMKWINKKRNKKGFTLVELVVVIAILSVLAMVAVPKLGSSRLSSQVAVHNANVRVLKSAGAMYLSDNPGAENGTISGLGEGKAKVEDYLDGDKLPERTVDVGDNKMADKFVVKIESGDIVVIPGEAEIVETDGEKIVQEKK